MEAAGRIFSQVESFVTKTPVILQSPTFSADEVSEILISIQQLLPHEPTLLRLNGPIIVVGDLHGHLYDLFFILSHYGFHCHYLFLGDFIDRGDFSIEVFLIIMVLKIMRPNTVHFIRGNHEFEDVSKRCGFYSEVCVAYSGFNLHEQFYHVFDLMPLAATIDGSIFCVHGGLSPLLSNISQISSIKRPVPADQMPLVQDIVWADPTDEFPGFSPSPRGTGFLFGKDATDKFMADNKLDLIIRAHECIDEGVRASFGSKVITIFSASKYCGFTPNFGAVLEISAVEQKPFKYDVSTEIDAGHCKLPLRELEKKRYAIRSSNHIHSYRSQPQPLLYQSKICKPPPSVFQGGFLKKKQIKAVKISGNKSML